VSAATLAEAAAGTGNTKFLSPETGVPKDASGMTGAAILPSGTSAQQPATPVVGMQRFNTDSGSEEVYTGATLGWRKFSFVQEIPAASDLTVPFGSTVTWASLTNTYNNVTIAGTVNLKGVSVIKAQGTVTIASTAVFNGDATGTPSTLSAGSGGGYLYGVPGRNIGGGQPGRYTVSNFTTTIYGPGTSLASSSGASGDGIPAFPDVAQPGTGGNGGASLVLYSQGPITFAGTASLKGGDGGNYSGTITINGTAVGGGGGGSGGLLLLESSTSINFSGAVDVSGGNGGNSIVAGVAVQNNAGGAGGGGYVVMRSPQNTVTGTITKTAGTQAVTSTNNAISGGGGSFGGQGGQVAVTAFSLVNVPATAGVFENNGVLS
jgi:hypothetical protein